MRSIDAAASGQFRIGDISINRLGYGAMRITGRGVWGPPADRKAALATLRRLPELGVNFIDTADSYGPDVSEELIREALHPYDGMLIATKAGFVRRGRTSGPRTDDRTTSSGRPRAVSESSALIESICGSCIASIPASRERNSSAPFVNFSMNASFAMRD
jgi:aryl-alcohol dehydrogenase-like predicted oxidoreductase